MKKATIKTIKDLKPVVLDTEKQAGVKAGGGGAATGIRIPPAI